MAQAEPSTKKGRCPGQHPSSDTVGCRVANQGNSVLMFESGMPLAFPEGQPLVLNLTAAIRVTGFVVYTQMP
jgi:hypothetical protein